ncbi:MULTISPECIES: hypothetical protein [unclassified Nocardioides]|uniref:hypothetical protein n=1 Tax=unclassified Nocardioides TaxID=2615069 RepID=UPI0030150252
MRSLIRVELTRLRWRRAVLLLLVASVVVPAVIAIAMIWDTRPPSADELTRIDELVAQERESPEVQEQLQDCLDHPENWGFDQSTTDLQTQCEESTLPQPEWFGSYTPLDLREQLQYGDGLGVVTVLTLLLMLAGTTFVGHDWVSGSMSNQLLFEPRRGRIWAAKGLVVTLVSLVVSVVVSSAYWLTLWLVARSRDLGSSSDLLGDCLEFGLRGALFATAAALAGFALTMLFRSTVATIGVLFALSVGGGLLIALLGLDGQWQPGPNLEAIVKNGTTYWDYDTERTLSALHGAVYYGVLVVGTAVASVASFRRRDVP